MILIGVIIGNSEYFFTPQIASTQICPGPSWTKHPSFFKTITSAFFKTYGETVSDFRVQLVKVANCPMNSLDAVSSFNCTGLIKSSLKKSF